MERDDIGIYIVVAAIIALLVGVLAFWFYAEITCFARGCTGGAGPGNEPEASNAIALKNAFSVKVLSWRVWLSSALAYGVHGGDYRLSVCNAIRSKGGYALAFGVNGGMKPSSFYFRR